MPIEYLESVIIEQADVIADQMQGIAQWANTEEDVRYECNKLIDVFLKLYGDSYQRTP